MPIHSHKSLVPYLVAFLFMATHGACGAPAYLIDNAYLGSPNPQALPAQDERTGEPRFVNPRKMQLDRPEPLSPELRDTRWRVKPRRPTGLVIAGAVTFGIGAALTLGGVAAIPCPPHTLCENGVAVGTLLGLGSFHLLIGGIQLIAAGAKWSPEVSGRGAW